MVFTSMFNGRFVRPNVKNENFVQILIGVYIVGIELTKITQQMIDRMNERLARMKQLNLDYRFVCTTTSNFACQMHTAPVYIVESYKINIGSFRYGEMQPKSGVPIRIWCTKAMIFIRMP